MSVHAADLVFVGVVFFAVVVLFVTAILDNR